MKMKKVCRSISVVEQVDFDPEISIAIEYTGIPVRNDAIPKALPIDVDLIPTARVAPSMYLLSSLSLPVAEPVVRTRKKGGNRTSLCPEVQEPKVPEPLGSHDDRVDSSGTLGFSDSQDHSLDLSQSSDMPETSVNCNEIEELSADEDSSDGEKMLEHRRKKRPTVVTFCEPETTEQTVYEEAVSDHSVEISLSVNMDRPVAEKPRKPGACYRCHRGNRFTEKEACIVCGAKYCRFCIRRVMGSMPEGRKCTGCIGYLISESKFSVIGRGSRLLKKVLSECEVKRVLSDELSSRANQLPHLIVVNDKELNFRKLMVLRNCPNPPRNLKPGRYWYDKGTGFWGKEGHKPCQIITPQLEIGGKLREDASNGNTKVKINGREITRPELWMMQSAGAQCAGNPAFWVDKDGGYQLEGMNMMGNIWKQRKTRMLCALLQLPTPETPNPTQVNGGSKGLLGNIDQKMLCKLLLVGNDHSGTSTIYKQARIIYNKPFTSEECQNIKLMIQTNLYKYLAKLLEGREQFEEEELLSKSSSGGSRDVSEGAKYAVSPKLKNFADMVIDSMVSGNLDRNFPAATREYAPFVAELWKSSAIQAAYNRRDELDLPRVAGYFLDKAVEIAQTDYEPSDTDILYAEGFTSFGGMVSMDFRLNKSSQDQSKDRSEQLDFPTQFELVRVHADTLGPNCKWLELFDNFNAVLFCVSLTEYNEYTVSTDGTRTNKMLQTRKLFEDMITHPSFDRTNFLLVLNKFDLFEEKIELEPLAHCEWFQDFNPVLTHNHNREGSTNSLPPLGERAFHYVAVKFKRLFRAITGRNLYVCPVTALESDSVETVMKYVKEVVEWEEENMNSCVNESSCESFENEQSSFSSH